MIDELIHHCIQEIGNDGEAGTELERLQKFIHDFHQEQSQIHGLPPQKIDQNYRSFVFRHLMAHPHVHVGGHVPGVVREEAGKSSITRKKERGGVGSKSEHVTTPALEYDWVDLIDDTTARQSSLDQLQSLHGDDLRIVLSSTVLHRMLAGPIDFGITAPIYKCLQIIFRARQNAVKSVVLGETMRYDQKTVFYITKKLIDQGLVTKIKARETGTQASFFVATKFLEKCPLWLSQKNADIKSSSHPHTASPSLTPQHPSHSSTVLLQTQPPGRETTFNNDDDDEDEDPTTGNDHNAPTIQLDHQDSATSDFRGFERVPAHKTQVWLASRTELVRLRIYLLCSLTKSKVTLRKNLLARLELDGAARFKRTFSLILGKMIINGQIQLVRIVIASEASEKGLKMTTKGEQEMKALLSGEAVDPDEQKRQSRAFAKKAQLELDLNMTEPVVDRERTIEYQIHERVAAAGTQGITLKGIQYAMHCWGHPKRFIEQAITMAEDATAEPCLADMRIRSVHEHKRRERRMRMYSQHAWTLQAANEGFLQDQGQQQMHDVGGWPQTNPSSLCADPNLAARETRKLVPEAFIDTQRKTYASADAIDIDPSPARRGRPPKNAETPSASKRIGRPPGSKNKNKLTTQETPQPSTSLVTPRKRSCQSRVESADPEQPAVSQGTSTHANPENDTGFTPMTGFGLGHEVEPTTPAEGAAKRRRLRAQQLQSQGEQQSTLDKDQHQATSPESALLDATLTETSSSTEPVTATQNATDDIAASSTSQHTSAQQSDPAIIQPIPHTPIPKVRQPPSLAGRFSAPATPETPREWIKEKARINSERKIRTNLTMVRSINALVQCIRDTGGALDSLLLASELALFVEKNKSTADVQVVNLRERRVRENAISKAIDQGLLRKTYVRLEAPDVSWPQRTIVYLPDVDPKILQQYCDDVCKSKAGWFRKSDINTVLTTETGQVSVMAGDAIKLQGLKPWEETSKLDPNELQDASLAEQMRRCFLQLDRVRGQFFGHIDGAMLRLRVFHQACVSALLDGESDKARKGPPHLIDLSYFWSDVTLDRFLALCSLRSHSFIAEQMCQDQHYRNAPMTQQPEQALKTMVLSARHDYDASNDVQIAIRSLAEQLADMGIMKPFKPDPENQKATTWELCQRLPVYQWNVPMDFKPIVQIIDAGLDLDAIRDFWDITRRNCITPYEADHSSDGLQNSTGSQQMPLVDASSEIQDPARATGQPAQTAVDDVFSTVHTPKSLINQISLIKSWRAAHNLQPSQRKFLDRFAGPDRQIPNVSQLETIAHVCLAPTYIVQQYLEFQFAAGGTNIQKGPSLLWPYNIEGIQLPMEDLRTLNGNKIAKQRKKREKGKVTRIVSREVNGRLATLQKARELRAKRETEFADMLEEGLSFASAAVPFREKIEKALRSIRKRFIDLDAGFNYADAKKAVHRAISSAAGFKLKPPVVVRAVETANTQTRVGGDGGTERETRRVKRSRRKTMPTNYWTPQKNELLRDAAVILRARDRARGRADWTAILQIIDPEEKETKTKGSLISQWRHQYYRIRDVYGEEGYLSALERKWMLVYQEARESGALVDPKYPSATEFSLVDHIDYLRTHIDKNEVQASLERASTKNLLPIKLTNDNNFTANWLDEFPPVHPETKWDPFFTSDVGHVTKRFELLLNNAFVIEAPTSFGNEQNTPTSVESRLLQQVAESAVKMVISTSEDSCNEDTKAKFCTQFGEGQIEAALCRMLEKHHIRAISQDVVSRRRPETNFVFTEEYLRSIEVKGERMPMTEMQHCLRLADKKLEQSVDHPLLVEPVITDGEAAALVTLMTEGMMTSQIDITPFANLRAHHAFNARILNDEEIESLIQVSITPSGLSTARRATSVLPDPPLEPILNWFETEENFETRWQSVTSSLSSEHLERLLGLRNSLEEQGADGLLLTECHSSLTYTDLLLLLSGDLPIAFLTGHSELHLISAKFITPHTITLPFSQKKILPRSWITLTGTHISTFHQTIQSVTLFILSRPGINLLSLSTRFLPFLSIIEIYQLVISITLSTKKFKLETCNSINPIHWTVHPTSSVWAGFELP